VLVAAQKSNRGEFLVRNAVVGLIDQAASSSREIAAASVRVSASAERCIASATISAVVVSSPTAESRL